MEKSQVKLKGEWLRIEDCSVINASELNIRFAGSGFKFKGEYICYKWEGNHYDAHLPAQWYQLFDYYYDPIDSEIVRDILGDCRQNFYIHTLFASLNPEDSNQVLRFCKYFGLPTYILPVDQLEEYLGSGYRDFQVLQSLDRVKDEIELCKLTFTLNSLTNKSIADSDKILPVIQKIKDIQGHSKDQIFINGKEVNPVSESEPALPVDTGEDPDSFEPYKVILEIINLNIRGISPILEQNDKKYYLNWQFGSLEEALYFMLSQDMSNRISPLLCENPHCGHFFIPSRESASYCSKTCQNRAKQQRYRKEWARRNQTGKTSF